MPAAESPVLSTIVPPNCVTASGIRRGSIPCDDEARLVSENMPLVQHIANQVIPPWVSQIDREDAIQEGRIGLLRAVRGFNPAMGFAFSTFAWKQIEWPIRRALRRRLKALHRVALIGDWEIGGFTDHYADPPFSNSVEAIALACRVKQLPAADRHVVIRVFGLDGKPPESLVDIGRHRGVTKQRVHQIYARAMHRLRLWSGASVPAASRKQATPQRKETAYATAS